MKLLYCDESNMESRDGDFLIYGGVVIDGESAKDLSETIEVIRDDYGVPKDFRLKFNPGPPHLSHDDFIGMKEAIITEAVKHGAKFLAYVTLHNIATDSDTARRNGINTICYHYDCILNRQEDCGLVLIDRFNDGNNKIEAHLREKFSVGLTGMPYAAELRLQNILGFHYSTIGQSHFPSLIDILVGTLRHCINVHTRSDTAQTERALKILAIIAPSFWSEKGVVTELGFQFSPKVIKSDRFRGMYQSLKDFLEQGGIVTEQRITNQREY